MTVTRGAGIMFENGHRRRRGGGGGVGGAGDSNGEHSMPSSSNGFGILGFACLGFMLGHNARPFR